MTVFAELIPIIISLLIKPRKIFELLRDMGMVTFSCSNEDSDDFCFYSTRKNKCARVTREGHTRGNKRGSHESFPTTFPQRDARNKQFSSKADSESSLGYS